MQTPSDVLDIKISNFFDDAYDYDIDRPHSLRQALANFENNVAAIKKVTEAMRFDEFDSFTCENALNWYYFDWDDAILPSEKDNYYFTLTMPTLLDVEYALEILEDKVADGIRTKVKELKAELWQLLPDFYKGHDNPPFTPLSYDASKPYPYKCASGTLKEAQGWKTRTWLYAVRDLEDFTSFMPDDSAPVTTISFPDDNVMVDGKSAPTSLFWTEVWPFKEMLYFAEDIANMHSPTWLSIDPEGPPVRFCAQAAPLAENVKLAIHWDSKRSMMGPGTIINIGGIISRRQLIQCFIEQCEMIVKPHEHSRYSDEYIEEVDQMVRRLKAMI